MQSIIIISKSSDIRQNYVTDFCNKHSVSPFDITTYTKELSGSQTGQSIGIDVIKQLKKNIFLMPSKGKVKVVYIADAQLLTTEAQNALLKILEEPPDAAGIILGVTKREALLKTIISRCRIIQLDDPVKNILIDKDSANIRKLISSIQNANSSQRLKTAEDLAKNKEQAVATIEKIILLLRDDLLKNYHTQNTLLTDIKKFQKLHSLLKNTNVNIRFAIEQTLLQLE